jgi:hypothetical protein
MKSDEYRTRYDALLTLVSQRLPNFIEAVASKETDTLMFHQDAFAADLQSEELTLLGAAVKFAGHHGKAILINGRCGETITDDVLRSPSQA